MGNNGSSSHRNCALPSDPLEEMGRGWTQSFPRERARCYAQPTGRKVLPEPPNQRLRATDNGSIIHNGGTISGRRPSTQTLPHDLNKQGVFRSRSTSATSMIATRARRPEHRCCRYKDESCCPESQAQDPKRFGSEPDLRYSPGAHCIETKSRRCEEYRAEKEEGERESRYKARKKYKAPAPPANLHAESSSGLGRKWECVQNREAHCCAQDVHPPPRRSRLFKTRAETKRSQNNWYVSSSSSSRRERTEGASEEERKNGAAEKKGQQRWRDQSRKGEYGRTEISDGKNTLRRSLSSPEFQAELMQAAKKVRNKLNRAGSPSVLSNEFGECASLENRSERAARNSIAGERFSKENNREKPEESGVRKDRESLEVRKNENVMVAMRKENKKVLPRDTSTAGLDYAEERRSTNASGDRIARPDKSSGFDEESLPRVPAREPLRERYDVPMRSPESKFSADKRRRDFGEDHHRRQADAFRSRKYADIVDAVKTAVESPGLRSIKDRRDSIRGQDFGTESTSERGGRKERDKENTDPEWWQTDYQSGGSRGIEKKRSDPVRLPEKLERKPGDKTARAAATLENCEENWNALSSAETSTPKTFYFGMNEVAFGETLEDNRVQRTDRIKSTFRSRGITLSAACATETLDDGKSVMEDISLRLRPTLPKKQLEIPRFSPSAAWRLLSALDAPGPAAMSTASEEIPVLFEERIERLSRPPPPLVVLGPRSSHDKSGDSGISGDAGAVNEDSLEISTTNRAKSTGIRPTWTPQQDLGEESSSDAGVDSPPPILTPIKFPLRAHVFSLSLPRDDGRLCFYNPESKEKEGSAFNSLQKLRRSVSGALGLGGASDLDRKHLHAARGTLDDNWLLSSSAPTSLQHNPLTEPMQAPPTAWRAAYPNGEGNLSVCEEREEEDEDEAMEDGDNDEDEDEEDEEEDRNNFPMIMKPPSFSYLAPSGHVMYLPESNDLESRGSGSTRGMATISPSMKPRRDFISVYAKKGSEQAEHFVRKSPNRGKNAERMGISVKDSKHRRGLAEDSNAKPNVFGALSKSCEDIFVMRQKSGASMGIRQSSHEGSALGTKSQPKNSSKGRRFTFQSTVRQIERRRLAEKLSREAEAKERQRRGELEAMRKVEEEFQRKRAREKANIRQQLRLYNMGENLSSLPVAWDNSQLSRADPDGAPSSSASSPTSAPASKLTPTEKDGYGSDDHRRKKSLLADSRQRQRDYKDYRPKYYDWSPDGSSHVDCKQTTIHPKIVCDIPKSSPVYLETNVNGNKPANACTTPKSDNYRKDFAHGAVAAKSSLASSDSELSQPNTRSHSRQTEKKIKSIRSRF
ncbi:hypothetical protein KM043_002033 [Ampulex compressa]|nr:hypothetical protein KM043_002033 [Ampulex compressa]